ncbi:hypothetical protein ARNL5_01201 [Anaerolineae bacterium]|nr:hypothetical protein ARNL5_01201 [Anaerolineae bacterium]
MTKTHQQKMHSRTCFGCGCENEHGLRIASLWEGDESVCCWTPEAFHTGPPGFLYGGIAASLIDCHSVCTAVADANRSAGRDATFDPSISYVTGTMNLRYLKPTPMQTVTLRARIIAREGRKTQVLTSLYVGELECVRGEVLAVRIDPSSFV